MSSASLAKWLEAAFQGVVVAATPCPKYVVALSPSAFSCKLCFHVFTTGTFTPLNASQLYADLAC